ncbi:MAG: hypothetical protein F4Z16_06530 [Rhodothermaceae bacterium]|nr:hypothetical protein [Rhodothermaceae bacterium]MYD66860.1 hypothetical protein [Rhodothermaceae bacterium]MYI78145.1 hypothetical protein [Gammaproteobacteria bacterium]
MHDSSHDALLVIPRTPAPPDVRACRRCGCWESDACVDKHGHACWWVESDLCSHCANHAVRFTPLQRWVFVLVVAPVLVWLLYVLVFP